MKITNVSINQHIDSSVTIERDHGTKITVAIKENLTTNKAAEVFNLLMEEARKIS